MKNQSLNRIEFLIFSGASLFLLFFYAYSSIFRPASTEYHRGIYVILTYALCFMVYRSRHFLLRIFDYTLIVASLISIGYWILNFEDINYRVGAENEVDRMIAVVGVLVGLELSRRVLGLIFPIMGIIFLTYGVYGYLFPEVISHSGASFVDLCTSIFYKSDGLFGIMPSVLANYVLLFIFFGAFLEVSKAQRFFIDFPMALVGHRQGGPAKVSIIASGFFGSISGSAIANTVSTGTFTIPMMKKAGFKPEVAGGVEPAASIGGMFMPPIMGAGGFIMAELTSIPYSTIMLVSLFPALLYFFSVYVMVHFYAKKNNLTGARSEITGWQIFKRGWHNLVPLIVITVIMLLGYSPAYAAVIGIVSCLVVGLINDCKKFSIKRFAQSILTASNDGFEQSIKIGSTVGVIGIIIGVLSFTGLVLTFADIIIEIAAGSLPYTILLIALASLVLGMGVPVTAAYLITAVVAVPSLTELGVPLLAAHMIVYWLSQDSNITPPVCIAAFTGATIAKANMWLTAIQSLKFAKMLYLAPFFFAYIPAFSLEGTFGEIATAFFLTTIFTFIFGYLLSGHWFKYFNRKAKT